jgi:EAL domain-containing protein (putative c-di-GMP-specific phosphodiesterase class I)
VAPSTDAKTGLDSRETFLDVAARAAGENAALTLVDIPGLSDLCARLPAEGVDRLLGGIGAAIRQSGATASGRLSQTRFAALAAATASLGLGKMLKRVFADAGQEPPAIRETAIGLRAPSLSSNQRLLALRFVVEKFSDGGKAPDGDIADAFTRLMQETQQRLLAMTQTVTDGDFTLVYQPIADLATGEISHYEALARFGGQANTGENVKFIEALGIADVFDLAVTAKILSLIAHDGRTHYQIAFNVSGHTIESPSSFAMLAALLAKNRKLAPRLLIEITETAEIQNLDNAGKAVAALRAMGYRVGLDDFGAGAASVNYLHAFPVDFVKFDGALIKKIGASPRDDALLGGLAKLCGEMGVATIAEWIADEAMAKAALALGFKKGQGGFLGEPVREIPDAPRAAARRKGVVESWQ